MVPSSDPTRLTVYLSAGGPVDAVPAALADLHALNLVEDFAVMPLDTVMGGRDMCRVRTADGWRIGSLYQVIAHLRPALLRFLVLSEVRAPLSDEAAQAAQRLTEQVMMQGGARVVRAHLMLTRKGDTPRPQARDGWHNILLSPEQSLSPVAGQTDPPPVGLGEGYGEHDTWTVAALGGLLTGQGESPLDEEALLPGAQVQLARSFIRRIDADALEARVKAETLSMEKGFPLPRERGGSATYVENTSKACTEAAETLWTATSPRFAGPRRQAAQAASQRIGAGQALAMFFSFLVAAITGAPAAWARSRLHAAKAQLSGHVQKFVFGPAATSRYAVTVGGVSAERPRSTEEMLSELRSQSAVLNMGEDEHRDHQDFSDVWRGLVSGTLTLLDGMKRSVFEPVRIGDRIGIVRAGRDVTGGTEPFRVADGNIARFLPTDTLHGPSFNEAYQMLGTLAVLKQDNTYARAASDVEQALTTWLRRHQSTFVGHFVERLAQAFQGRLKELDACTELLRLAAGDDDGGAELGRSQRRLGRHLVVLAATALVLLLGLLWLYVLAVITTAVFVVGIVVVLITHLVVSLTVFLKGQREYFQMLHARETAVTAAEAAAANLPVITRECVMLGDAYQLALRWAGVLAVFAADPLPSTGGDDRARPRLGTPLPLNVTLGEAESDDIGVAETVDQLRTRLFQRGWLDGPWRSLLAGAKRRLGTAGVSLSDDVEALYHQRATAEDDLLDRWLEILRREGASPAAADAAWAQALGHLQDPTVIGPDSIVRSVRLEGGRGSQRYEEMVATWHRAGGQNFVPGNLHDAAVGQGANRIRTPWTARARTGLGTTDLRVDFSEGIAAYHFGAGASSAGSEPAGSVEQPVFLQPNTDLVF